MYSDSWISDYKNLYLFLLLFFILCFVSCTEKEYIIALQSYDSFSNTWMDTIAITLKQTYNANIIELPNRKIPKNSFVNIKSPRYRADSLLLDLKKHKPDSIDFILGLTHKDISTTKRQRNGDIKEPASKYNDWGVFGLGYCPGPSCIVSTFRLGTNNKALFISRLKKICIHEVGHNFGLKHCKTPGCVMNDAVETIRTVDAVNYSLCDVCFKKIN